jgi:hypothetical protein
MKTNLDLLTASEAIARLMLQAPNDFAAEQAKIENFVTVGGDPLDWDTFNNFTTQRLGQYRQAQSQQTPSALAAAASAKAAAQAAPKTS